MHPSYRHSDESSEEDGTSSEDETQVSSRSARTQSVHDERNTRSSIPEGSSSFSHVVPSKSVSISSTAASIRGVVDSGISAGLLPREIKVGDRVEVQDTGDAEW